MRSEMKKMNLPDPEFIEERGSFKVIFRNKLNNVEQVSEQVSGIQSGHQSGHQNDTRLMEYMNKLCDFCKIPRTSKEIREYLKINSRTYVSTNIIKPLIDLGYLEYTIKNNVRDKNQKYITRNKL